MYKTIVNRFKSLIKPLSSEQALAKVLTNAESFKDLNSLLRDDDLIAWHAVTRNYSNIKYISKRLADSEVFMLSIQTPDSLGLKYASPRLKNNKNFVLNAVTRAGSDLKHASSDLQNDLDVVNTAITNAPASILFAGKYIKNDQALLKKLLITDSAIFKYLGAALQDNAELAKIATQNKGIMLKYASVNLRSDDNFVLDAAYLIESMPSNVHIQNLVYTRAKEASFIIENKHLFDTNEWPVIKKALLTKPDIMLNPPAAIASVIDSMEHKYLYLAYYALNTSINVYPNSELPQLDITV